MKQFRHPRPYIDNNIDFRILTSESLHRYKLSQSVNLKGIKYNTSHHFSKTGKEIILFKYDVYFDFLCNLEQYLLFNDFDIIFICRELEKIYEYTFQKLKESEKLDKNYLYIWKEIHYKTLFYHILKYFRNTFSSKKDFNYITDMFINLMNELIFEIIELDNLLYKNKLVLHISIFCEDMKRNLNVSPAKERLMEYAKIRPDIKILNIMNFSKNCKINMDKYVINEIKERI